MSSVQSYNQFHLDVSSSQNSSTTRLYPGYVIKETDSSFHPTQKVILVRLS